MRTSKNLLLSILLASAVGITAFSIESHQTYFLLSLPKINFIPKVGQSKTPTTKDTPKVRGSVCPIDDTDVPTKPPPPPLKGESGRVIWDAFTTILFISLGLSSISLLLKNYKHKVSFKSA